MYSRIKVLCENSNGSAVSIITLCLIIITEKYKGRVFEKKCKARFFFIVDSNEL